jgi:hypothetical protein
MATKKKNRMRLGLFAIVFGSLALGSGFMACASGETLFADTSGAGGNGTGGASSCDLATCPEPPFSGLQKCCTTDGVCGYQSGAAGTCYPPGQTSSGAGGSGGMGGGKL